MANHLSDSGESVSDCAERIADVLQGYKSEDFKNVQIALQVDKNGQEIVQKAYRQSSMGQRLKDMCARIANKGGKEIAVKIVSIDLGQMQVDIGRVTTDISKIQGYVQKLMKYNRDLNELIGENGADGKLSKLDEFEKLNEDIGQFQVETSNLQSKIGILQTKNDKMMGNGNTFVNIGKECDDLGEKSVQFIKRIINVVQSWVDKADKLVQNGKLPVGTKKGIVGLGTKCSGTGIMVSDLALPLANLGEQFCSFEKALPEQEQELQEIGGTIADNGLAAGDLGNTLIKLCEDLGRLGDKIEE